MTTTFRIIGNISAICGVFATIFTFVFLNATSFSTIQYILISFFSLICLIYIIYELCNLPRKYKTDEEIMEYMRKWVKKTGRTVIFTRDMSWVNTIEIKEDLRNKAKNKDLLICLPKHIDFTLELESIGAEIYTYNNLNFTPKSRFTFINYNTSYSKVAIGRKDNKHNHYIEEYSHDNKIEYFLAEDLVNLVKALK